MKGKKLLAGSLSAAMVIGTMVVPAFADEADVFEIGTGHAYADLRTAVTAATDSNNDGKITYKIFGKTVLEYAGTLTEWYSVLGSTAAKEVNFIAGDEDAELVLKNGANDGQVIIIGIQDNSAGVTVNFDGLTLSRENAKWVGDIAQAGELFTTFVRSADTEVNYTDCTFPQGVYNNQYGKTTFTKCTFGTESKTKYGLWISPNVESSPNTVEVDNSTFYGSVKVYGQGGDNVVPVTTTISDSKFVNITKKPGIVSNQKGTMFIKNTTFDCALGEISNLTHESNQTATEAIAEIFVDGEAPEYEAMVENGSLFTKKAGAKEYAETSKIETVIAQIGNNCYKTLADAVAAAQDGDTVKLLADSNGDGIKILSGSNLTIDFGGHTYTVDGALVGSPTTESQAFQLLKNSTIKFKNGKITSAIAGIAIQNYSDLTLEDMTVELTTDNRFGMAYTVSNNNGNVVFTGNTNIIASKNCTSNVMAFDVCRYSSYPGVSVTLDENMNGTIDGGIEISGKKNDGENLELIIKNGNVNGEIKPASNAVDYTVAISGGSFSTDVSKYCADGYKPTKVNGRWVVGEDNSTDEISLKFEKVDERTYAIKLVSAEKEINKLNAAQFKFALTKDASSADVITYEIAPVEKMALIPQKDDVYELHFDGKDGVATDSGKEVKIGTVTFDGFGKFTFGATEGKVTATTGKNNLVTEFVVNGDAGKGTLELGTPEIIELTVPQHKLTINIAMNHPVKDNETAYQNMTVEISGGNLGTNTKKYALGIGGTELNNGIYTITADLDENGLYTVTVKGAGYRTARYTVALTEDKTMNLWNNVMTDKTIVVDDVKAKTNFLAGDIIKDGTINIYDLSAVVAYFNADKTLTTTEYNKLAKYDLNRDGKIDMMDISIVLTSWNN